jgi:anthranilate phosphoribosyltransferase
VISLAPILRRIAIRTRPASQDSSAFLDVEEAQRLFGALLDDAVPDIEMGALLASLALAGESTDELLGLQRALVERSVRWPASPGRQPIAIPLYGLFPGEVTLAALLAMFLRRFDVPVILHGPLDAPGGPSAAVLMRHLDVLPCTCAAQAEAELASRGIVFIPAQLISTAFASMLAMRARLGTPNAAHFAAQAMDPGGTGAVRIGMSIAGTTTDRLLGLHRAVEGDALVLAWPAGKSPANLAFRPRITRIRDGVAEILFDAEAAEHVAPASAMEDPVAAASWIRAVATRAAPVPVPLVNLAAACIYSTGLTADFAQAKAIAALQAGRLAA